MDNRLKKINSQLSEFSKGKFDKKIQLSPSLDEVDAIANGINMVGEELNAVTISKNYFTNIFNAVSDMVLIVSIGGRILDANASAEQLLGFTKEELKQHKFNALSPFKHSLFHELKTALRKKTGVVIESGFLQTRQRVKIPVKIIASYFKDHYGQRFIIITAGDITYQIKTNNLILRAMIDAEERERNRLAKDLHDTLTQQLSAIKFYIAGAPLLTADSKLKEILGKANAAMADVITEMRNISFYLMPKTLKSFGLVRAVREFCDHFLTHGETKFFISEETVIPELPAAIKIDMYRIIQEFINNAVRHGRATGVHIQFDYKHGILKILLKDNGSGFDPAVHQSGMGLQNVKSRVKSHSGEIVIGKRKPVGMYYDIKILIL